MSKQDELIAAEQAQDAVERAAFDALPTTDPDATDVAEEPTVAVEAEPEKAAPVEEEKPEPSAEYEDAKKRLAFAKLDPEEYTEEQAIKLAATLREEQVSKDKLLQEAAELRKQIEAKSESDGNAEQSSELGRPTEQPTPEPVDVSDSIRPVAELLGLDDSEGKQLGAAMQQIVANATQAQANEVSQLREAVMELANRAVQAEYGGRFPDASPSDLQEMFAQAQALAGATPNGDFDASLDLIYQGRFGKKEGVRSGALPKQPKPGSTPSKKKAPGSGPLTAEEKARAYFESLP